MVLSQICQVVHSLTLIYLGFYTIFLDLKITQGRQHPTSTHPQTRLLHHRDFKKRKPLTKSVLAQRGSDDCTLILEGLRPAPDLHSFSLVPSGHLLPHISTSAYAELGLWPVLMYFRSRSRIHLNHLQALRWSSASLRGA